MYEAMWPLKGVEVVSGPNEDLSLTLVLTEMIDSLSSLDLLHLTAAEALFQQTPTTSLI